MRAFVFVFFVVFALIYSGEAKGGRGGFSSRGGSRGSSSKSSSSGGWFSSKSSTNVAKPAPAAPPSYGWKPAGKKF